jgi:hypothetical protein
MKIISCKLANLSQVKLLKIISCKLVNLSQVIFIKNLPVEDEMSTTW